MIPGGVAREFSLFRLKRSVLLGLKSLWLHKLRSLLTALGIVFGVCSVIAMLAIGEGASYEAQQQIKELGSQNVILHSVKPTNKTTAGEEERSLILEYGITYRDVSQIQATVPGVLVAVPAREAKDFIWNESRSIDGVALGTVPWFPEMRNRTIWRGRYFTELELADRAPVCVLSKRLARHLFPLSEPIGDTVRIRSSYFRVIGVISDDPATANEEPGTPGGGQSTDGMEMMIPISTLEDHFGEVIFKHRSGSFEAEKVELHEVTVRIDNPERVMPAADAIRHILERNHKNVDYTMVVPLDLLRRAERTKQIFNIVLGSIAAISLIVGGIGIMNIMLATVTERTREIGIRLAIGALEREVLLQFLVEAVALSALGGIIGIILATLASIGLAGVMQVPFLFDPAINLLAFLFSAAIGVIFGYFPARRAARLDPIEALRHE